MSRAPHLIGTPVSVAEAIADGRQSERALAIRRGTCRLLASLGKTALAEVTLPDGRRADLVALSGKGEIAVIEIKSSVEDFRADQKWPDYRAWSDRIYFAVAPDFPRDLLPPDAGMIIADRYGAEILREAPLGELPGARRRTLNLRFARIAALRLMLVADPELRLDEGMLG